MKDLTTFLSAAVPVTGGLAWIAAQDDSPNSTKATRKNYRIAYGHVTGNFGEGDSGAGD